MFVCWECGCKGIKILNSNINIAVRICDCNGYGQNLLFFDRDDLSAKQYRLLTDAERDQMITDICRAMSRSHSYEQIKCLLGIKDA